MRGGASSWTKKEFQFPSIQVFVTHLHENGVSSSWKLYILKRGGGCCTWALWLQRLYSHCQLVAWQWELHCFQCLVFPCERVTYWKQKQRNDIVSTGKNGASALMTSYFASLLTYNSLLIWISDSQTPRPTQTRTAKIFTVPKVFIISCLDSLVVVVGSPSSSSSSFGSCSWSLLYRRI